MKMKKKTDTRRVCGYGSHKSVRYHLCLLLLVRPAGYIVNLYDFYSYRLIEKLTAFLQL
jgi:hypothetical protein